MVWSTALIPQQPSSNHHVRVLECGAVRSGVGAVRLVAYNMLARLWLPTGWVTRLGRVGTFMRASIMCALLYLVGRRKGEGVSRTWNGFLTA